MRRKRESIASEMIELPVRFQENTPMINTITEDEVALPAKFQIPISNFSSHCSNHMKSISQLDKEKLREIPETDSGRSSIPTLG